MTSERELVGREIDELIRKVTEESGSSPVFVVKTAGNYERHVHSITQRAIIDPPGWVKAGVVLLAANLVVCSVLLYRSFAAAPIAQTQNDSATMEPGASYEELLDLVREARDFSLKARNEATNANRRATKISRHLKLEPNPGAPK